jgi:hypothetical protein
VRLQRMPCAAFRPKPNVRTDEVSRLPQTLSGHFPHSNADSAWFFEWT